LKRAVFKEIIKNKIRKENKERNKKGCTLKFLLETVDL